MILLVDLSLWREGLLRGAEKTTVGHPLPCTVVSAALSSLPPVFPHFRDVHRLYVHDMFPFSTYMYIHIIYIYCVVFPFFLFLRNKPIKIIPQQMSEMYYCKVYFFYNIVYDGIKGGGLPVARPAGAGPGGAPDRAHAGPGPNKCPRKQPVSCLAPVCLAPLASWPRAAPRLLPWDPSGPSSCARRGC